jgi:NADP-dependent alcohol dehydrogenase
LNDTIAKTEAFFREMGMLTKLSEHNIGGETIDRITARFEKRDMQLIGAQQDISLNEVGMILKSRL